LRNVDALLHHLAGVGQAHKSERYPAMSPQNAVLEPTGIMEIVYPGDSLSL
jgi:hypothetical protein